MAALDAGAYELSYELVSLVTVEDVIASEALLLTPSCMATLGFLHSLRNKVSSSWVNLPISSSAWARSGSIIWSSLEVVVPGTTIDDDSCCLTSGFVRSKFGEFFADFDEFVSLLLDDYIATPTPTSDSCPISSGSKNCELLWGTPSHEFVLSLASGSSASWKKLNWSTLDAICIKLWVYMRSFRKNTDYAFYVVWNLLTN